MQRRTEPRDHGNGAGQTDLVIDGQWSIDPVVAEDMVIGVVRKSLLPSLGSQGLCKGWRYCKR